MSAMQSDFSGEDWRWMWHLREIAGLAAKLPDGDARMDAFAEQMLAASDPDAFMSRESEAADGVVVVHLFPGPVAMQFLADLRAAVAAQGEAA